MNRLSDRNLSDRIIVPLDVSSAAAAIALVDRLPQVGFWKVGLELFISSGPAILAELKHKAGADHLVIGRPITAAPDPAAFDRICEEIA